MRLPISWIKEFIPLENSPEEISELLTRLGIEVEGIEEVIPKFSGIKAVRIVEVQPHPSGENLRIAVVEDGTRAYTVVCGAPNCRKGLVTALAAPGSHMSDITTGEAYEISTRKIRGVDSEGMLCSGKELGLSEEHREILELQGSFEAGEDLAPYYRDVVLSISLTPNLNHCSSLLGIARELSAATGIPVHLPKIDLKEGEKEIEEGFSVEIENLKDCPRYTCRYIANVNVQGSPEWIKNRLILSGIRPINNVVDITNYVLLEFGHPLHAFDAEKLAGNTIRVKNGIENEVFVTLDGKERTLSGESLMICDAEKPVAIAGVMGGANSEVNMGTKNVLLEAAYFRPGSIRKTSKRLGLQTEASKRFERGTDPQILEKALNRASELIGLYAEGEIFKGIIDKKDKDFTERTIECRLAYVQRVLGIPVSISEISTIFKRLQFSFQRSEERFSVTVPSYRNDILTEIDLVEEIARFYGFEKLKGEEHRYQTSQIPHSPFFLFERQLRNRLAAEGLQEFLNCDLIGPTLFQIMQEDLDSHRLIKVLNPTSIEQSILRPSLIPGLLETAKHNIDHQNHTLAGFEIGKSHYRIQDRIEEPSLLAMILTGKKNPVHWDEKVEDFDFYDLKGIIENLLKSLGIEKPEYKNLGYSTFHTGRQASIFVNGLELGTFGEVHPEILRRLDVSQRILAAELSVKDLMEKKADHIRMKPLPVFPASDRDWTLTVEESMPFEKIRSAIADCAAEFLQTFYLLDIYRSEKIGTDKKNITIRFVYRDPSKTISQEIVDAEHRRITTHVSKILQLP